MFLSYTSYIFLMSETLHLDDVIEDLYLLQQSYPHGSVCGGKHLHNHRDDLLLVLFC